MVVDGIFYVQMRSNNIYSTLMRLNDIAMCTFW